MAAPWANRCWLWLLLASLLTSSTARIALSDLPDAGLMWSARPLSDASLTRDGLWEDVLDTNVTVHLEKAAEVLVSYVLTATAVRRQSTALGGSDFFSSGIALSGIGQRNFLQLRVVVDGSPFRQSSSHASPGLSLEANTETLTGHTAVSLQEGAHDVRLQWKKVGAGVTSWASLPTAADGFSSGRSLVVTGRHKYIWHKHPDSVARIDVEGQWHDLPGMTLGFTLDKDASLRLLYSMTVRSDQVDAESGTSQALWT